MTQYRILSLDGGPANATYLRFLREIEIERPGFLARTELFAGTSDGTIASIYMASRPPSEQGLTTLLNTISLSNKIYLTMQAGLCGLMRLFGGVLSMDFNSNLKKILSDYFGPNTLLGDLQKKVCLVSYRVKQPTGPKIFHNYGTDPDIYSNAVNVALCSAAFPVLLPLRQGHVDGAIFANNPSMCALTEVISQKALLPDVDSPNDITIFSLGGDDKRIGTFFDQYLFQRIENLPWGWIPWLLNPFSPLTVFNLLINSNNKGVSFQCEQLLEDRFLRLAILAGTEIDGLLRVVFNRSQEAIDIAEKTAIYWRTHPTSTVIRPNFKETIDWVDQKWM